MGQGVVLVVSQSGMRKLVLGLALGCWYAQPAQIPRHRIYHVWEYLLPTCPEMPTLMAT